MSSTASLTTLINAINAREDFDEDLNFMILCEGYPIKNRFNYVCKPLFIIFQNGKKETVLKITPDLFEDYCIKYFTVSENSRRKLGSPKTPFKILGNTKLLTYKDSEYVEYTFTLRLTPVEKNLIKQIREKFEIEEPTEFVAANITTDLEL